MSDLEQKWGSTLREAKADKWVQFRQALQAVFSAARWRVGTGFGGRR